MVIATQQATCVACLAQELSRTSKTPKRPVILKARENLLDKRLEPKYYRFSKIRK